VEDHGSGLVLPGLGLVGKVEIKSCVMIIYAIWMSCLVDEVQQQVRGLNEPCSADFMYTAID